MVDVQTNPIPIFIYPIEVIQLALINTTNNTN